MAKSSLAKNIFSIISIRILLKGINFISLYILLRYLTPQQLGEYGLFISTLVLATTVGNLGLRNAVAREIGDKGEFSRNIKALAIAYPLLMFSSTLAMLSILYFSGFILGLSPKLGVIVIAVISHLIIILRQGVCLGTGDIKLFNALEIFPRLVLLLIILIVIKGIDGVYEDIAIYGLSFGYMVTAIYELFKTKFEFSIATNKQVRHLFKKGFSFCLALSLILLNTRIPLYVTNLIQCTAETGEVFAALRVNDIFLELATATGLVLFSHSARAAKSIDLNKMFKTIFGVFIATLFIAVITFYFANDLISLVSGGQYKTAAMYLSIATIGLPFAAFNKMAYGVISGKGKPMLGVYVYFLAISTNILTAYVLYKKSIDGFVLYGLVSSQIIAAILFLVIIINLKKRIVLDNR